MRPTDEQVREAREFWSREPGSYPNVDAMLKYGDILNRFAESVLGDLEKQHLHYMTSAAEDFAEGRISAGKLAELLGVRDVHTFKVACHAFCEERGEPGEGRDIMHIDHTNPAPEQRPVRAWWCSNGHITFPTDPPPTRCGYGRDGCDGILKPLRED